jgi:hypothetical protein
MREAGFDAFQFQGGIRGLMALAEQEEGMAAALLAPAVRD